MRAARTGAGKCREVTILYGELVHGTCARAGVRHCPAFRVRVGRVGAKHRPAASIARLAVDVDPRHHAVAAAGRVADLVHVCRRPAWHTLHRLDCFWIRGAQSEWRQFEERRAFAAWETAVAEKCEVGIGFCERIGRIDRGEETRVAVAGMRIIPDEPPLAMRGLPGGARVITRALVRDGVDAAGQEAAGILRVVIARSCPLRVILSRQQRAIKTESSTHKSRKYLHLPRSRAGLTGSEVTQHRSHGLQVTVR